MIAGTGMVAATGMKSAVFTLVVFGFTLPGYAAVYAVLVNLAIAVPLTLILGAGRGTDRTLPEDYEAEGDGPAIPVLVAVGE